MPPRNNDGLPATKSTDKKTAVKGVSNPLDDAPLFAGLDDYNLQQAEKTNMRATEEKRVKERKETVQRQPEQAAPRKSLPPTVSKTPETTTSGTDAVLLSVPEMCTLLKISRATLVRMDKSGQLPGRIKLGGSVRFHRETVDSWLQGLIKTNPASS